MSKKRSRKKRRDGWPKGPREQLHHRTQVLRGALLDLSNETLSENQVVARLQRLTELFLRRPALRVVRPRQQLIHDTLAELSEADRQALRSGAASPRRAQRVRQRVLPRLFTAAFLTRLSRALAEAVAASQHDEDIEALAVGIYYTELASRGALPPERNPVLDSLMTLLCLENEQMEPALEALYAATEPDEAGQPPTREQFQKRMSEATGESPAHFLPIQQHLHERTSDLFQAIVDGTIQARLPGDAMRPMAQALLDRIVTAQQGTGASARTTREIAEAFPQELGAFASDPAHGPLFDTFDADLRREAEQAREAGEDRAQALEDLYAFWSRFHSLLDTVNQVVVNGCVMQELRRLRAERAREEKDEPTPGDADAEDAGQTPQDDEQE